MKIHKAYETAAAALRARIAGGEWPAGTRLPSVERLAADFGVGRSTIREALMSLKAHGWVDVRHGGGTFVLRNEEPASALWDAPEISDVRQLKAWLELRFMLETESAGLAAVRREELHLTGLRAIVQAMREDRDETLLERADIRFHVALAEAAGNHLLVRTLQSLFQSMSTAMNESRRLWLFAEQSQTGRLTDEHQAIVDAVQACDAPLAKERMASHLRKVEQVLGRIGI